MLETVKNEIQTEMGGFRAFSSFFYKLEILRAAKSFMRPETVFAPQRSHIRKFRKPGSP